MKSTDNPQQVITFETSCVARTKQVPDFVDVTDAIADAVTGSRVGRGRATVFVPESTCSLMVNERESGLLVDLGKTMERLRTTDASHPVIGSSSVVVPIEDGELRLGRWQRVLLVELTGAATRTVVVQIIGEP